MNINWKESISVLAVSCTLFFVGCGGGGTSGTGGSESGGREDIGGVDGSFKYDRVSIAGSSITWGGAGADGGYLGEKSYVGEVEKYLREVKADTINPAELAILTTPDNVINELYSYQGKLNVYKQGAQISGSLEASDEVVIVYGGSNAVVEMEVDGVKCGTQSISGNFKPVKILNPNNQVDGFGQVRSFRETDRQSVAKICKNLENKSHNFTLTVKSGELHLNFITNHMYYLQNAGIGGYRASDLLKEKAVVQNTTTDQIIAFKPDLFILESATNDAEPWGQEDDKSTNKWKIDNAESCTIENNLVKGLNISGTGIGKGDVVVIGEYNGDMNNMAVGIVSSIDGNNIKLDRDVVSYGNTPISGTSKCRVKSISVWEDDVKNVVDRVKKGVGSHVIVGIGTSGVPNYYNPNFVVYQKYKGKSRRLLGYREVGQKLAKEKSWMFFDFFTATLNVNSGVDDNYDGDNGVQIKAKKWSIGDNTHPSEKGFPIFGKVITDKL